MNRGMLAPSGMIAGPDPLAVEAGANALADGGNAIDAAVTCAFVQGVVNPANTGLGGYALLTFQPAAGGVDAGNPSSLDAPATAGSLVLPDMWVDRFQGVDASGWGFLLDGALNEFGYASICTPGLVRGLATALERWGTIDLGRAIEPAARLCEDGYVVDERVAAHWSVRFQLSSERTVLDYVRANPAASRIYLAADGGPQRAGQLVDNPDYGRSLRAIGELGAAAFYDGPIGDRISSDLADHGAFVTAADLSGYRVRDLPPVVGNYRGYRVTSSPAPHGGPTLLAFLKIVEGWDVAAMEHNSPGYIVRMAAAMKAAFVDRNRSLGDPYFVEDSVDWTSSERADNWRRRIESGQSIDPDPVPESSGTTHVTVVDAAGNIASLTHSLGGSSGVITPGLGFLFNNSMANFDPRPGHPNSIAPGKSRSTGMTPTILGRGDKPALALGASGATKIITAVAQVILNVVDFGMTAQEAINAPRFDCQSGPIRCHIRIPESVCEVVRRTHPIERIPSAYGGLGLVHAVAIEAVDGRLIGGVDPGSSGMALSVRSSSGRS